MDFSEDWKSRWPISSIFSPPLLLPNEGSSPSKRRHVEKHPIGPLIFNPCQETLTQLFNSPSLAPRLPPPYPDVTLQRFLSTSSINYSAASTIASNLGPQVSDTVHNFNALQLLRCPKINADNDTTHTTVLAFFPTGDNYDQLGFTMLNLNDSKLSVQKFKDGKDFFVHSHKLNHRILRLLVNPVADFDSFNSSPGNYCYSASKYTCIGYIMVCTMYSVHWYSVKMPKGVGGIILDYAGHAGVKLFQGSAVVHACWSPHLSEECVVLLESGKLFLFDVSYRLKNKRLLNVQGKKLCVSWDNLNENGKWLSCEFSWHPRIFVVAHSCAVFLVDFRFDKCEICTLLKIELFSAGKFDRFVALSKSDSSGFCFAVASNSLLILCDVRKPSMPVLQWAHGLQNPEYVTVFQLSELRPIMEDNLKWASESGHCILLGSFWNCEFIIFCYGPDNERGPILSEISTVCNSLYSWGLPSELSLSGHDCFCGSCLIRRDFSKDLLPDWIDWKQKKDIILGFGILENDLHFQWDNCEKFVGFSLIRLMSSGKLEVQRYSAAWEFDKILEAAHKESTTFSSEDNFLYDTGNGENELRKKHEYLKIDFLKEYLSGNFAKFVNRRQIQLQKYAEENQSKFHQEICEKMKICGTAVMRSALMNISDMFKDARFPTSIHEISSKNIWASLPMNLLALAFSASKLSDPHLNQKRAASNMGDILDKNPFPFPFPVLPIHLLILLCNQQLVETDILPVDDELRLNCDKVMEAARALQSSEHYSANIVSLANDTDEMPNAAEKLNILGIHRPTAFSSLGEKSEYMMYETFVYQKREEPISDAQNDEVTAVEVFDEGCPLELKFDSCEFDLTPTELDLFQQLKRQELNFQKSFHPYQEYLTNS